MGAIITIEVWQKREIDETKDKEEIKKDVLRELFRLQKHYYHVLEHRADYDNYMFDEDGINYFRQEMDNIYASYRYLCRVYNRADYVEENK